MHYESSTLGKGYGINFGAKHFGEHIYWGLGQMLISHGDKVYGIKCGVKHFGEHIGNFM
jgi:hypothetical protein